MSDATGPGQADGTGLSDPAAAYLDLFSPTLVQSQASKAYHSQFLQPSDQVLWHSRLRRPRGPVLADSLRAHGLEPRGVLHVGGHYGLELEAYLVGGFQRVTFFEASALVLDHLRAHVAFWEEWLAVLRPDPPVRLEVVECAVSDHEGRVPMHLAELEMLTSLHRPAQDWIRVQHTVEVDCARLDTLVGQPQDYNLLNLDVQGHELAVLRGAGQTLRHLDAVLVELNYEARYEECAMADDVDRQLREAGFTRADHTHYGPSVADALYIRT